MKASTCLREGGGMMELSERRVSLSADWPREESGTRIQHLGQLLTLGPGLGSPTQAAQIY